MEQKSSGKRRVRKWNWEIEGRSRTPFPILKPLCEGRNIVVYATKFQGNYGSNQCVCMALNAIVVGAISRPASSFNSVTMDYILRTGQELYEQVVKYKYPTETNPLLAVFDVEFIITGEPNPTKNHKDYSVVVKMRMHNVGVASHKAITAGMKRLEKYIPEASHRAVRSLLVMDQWLNIAFKIEESWGAIILYDGYAYSIIRNNGRCYFFDSHANRKKDDKPQKYKAMLLEIANSADVIRLLLLKRGLTKEELSLHNVYGDIQDKRSRQLWESRRKQYTNKPFQPLCEEFTVYSIILQYINDPDKLLTTPNENYENVAPERSDAGVYLEPEPQCGHITVESSDDDAEVNEESKNQNVVQKRNVDEKTNISTSDIAAALPLLSSPSSPAYGTIQIDNNGWDFQNMKFDELKILLDSASAFGLSTEDILAIQTRILRLVIKSGRADNESMKMNIMNEFRKYRRQHNIAILKGVLASGSEDLRKQFVRIKTSIPMELLPVLFPDYYIVPWTEPQGDVQAYYVGPLIDRVQSDELKQIVTNLGIGDYYIVDAKESIEDKYNFLEFSVSTPLSTTGPLYIKKSIVRNSNIANHHQWVILLLAEYDAVQKYWFVDDYEYNYEDFIHNPYLPNDDETVITIDTFKDENDNVAHVIDKLIDCASPEKTIFLPSSITTKDSVQNPDNIEAMDTNTSETPGPSSTDNKDDAGQTSMDNEDDGEDTLLNTLQTMTELTVQLGWPQCDDEDASKSSLDTISDKESEENINNFVETFTALQPDETTPVKKSSKSSGESSSSGKKKKRDKKTRTPEEPNVQKTRISSDIIRKAKKKTKPTPRTRNEVTLVKKKGKLNDDKSTPTQNKPSAPTDTFNDGTSIDETGSSKTDKDVSSVEIPNLTPALQDSNIDADLTDSKTKTLESPKPENALKITTIPDTEKTNAPKPSTSSTSYANVQPATPVLDDAKIKLPANDDHSNDFSHQNSTDAFDIGQSNKESTVSNLIKDSGTEDIETLANQFSPGSFNECVENITKDDISMETLSVTDTQLTAQETNDNKNIIKDDADSQQKQQTSSQSQNVTFQTDDALFNSPPDIDSNRTPEQIKNDIFVDNYTEGNNFSPQTQTQTPQGDSSSDTIAIQPTLSKKPQKRKSESETATKSTDLKRVSKKSKGDPSESSQPKAIGEETRLKLQQKLKRTEPMDISGDFEYDKTNAPSSSVASIEIEIPQAIADSSVYSTNVSSGNLAQDNIVSNIQAKSSDTSTVKATKTPISSPKIDVVVTASKEKENVPVSPAATSSQIADDANAVVTDPIDIMMDTSLPDTTSTDITNTTTTVVDSSGAGATTTTQADTTILTDTPKSGKLIGDVNKTATSSTGTTATTNASQNEIVTSTTSTATATFGNTTDVLTATTASSNQNETVILTATADTTTETVSNKGDVAPTINESVSQNATSTAEKLVVHIPICIVQSALTTTVSTTTSANITKTTLTATTANITKTTLTATTANITKTTLTTTTANITKTSSTTTITTTTPNTVGIDTSTTSTMSTKTKNVTVETGGSISATTTPTTSPTPTTTTKKVEVLISVLTTSVSSTTSTSSTTTTTVATATPIPTVVVNDSTKKPISSENIAASNAAKDITPTSSSSSGGDNSSSSATPQFKKPTNKNAAPKMTKSTKEKRKSDNPVRPQKYKLTREKRNSGSASDTGSATSKSKQSSSTNATGTTSTTPKQSSLASATATTPTTPKQSSSASATGTTLKQSSSANATGTTLKQSSSANATGTTPTTPQSKKLAPTNDDSATGSGLNVTTLKPQSSSMDLYKFAFTDKDAVLSDTSVSNDERSSPKRVPSNNESEEESDDDGGSRGRRVNRDSDGSRSSSRTAIPNNTDENGGNTGSGSENNDSGDDDNDNNNGDGDGRNNNNNEDDADDENEDEGEEEGERDTGTESENNPDFETGEYAPPTHRSSSPRRHHSSGDDGYMYDGELDYPQLYRRGRTSPISASSNEEEIEHAETLDTGLEFSRMSKKRKNAKKRQLQTREQRQRNRQNVEHRQTRFIPIPSSSSQSSASPSTSKSAYETEYLEQLRKGIASADDNCNLVTTRDASDSGSEDCADVPDSYRGIPLNLLDSSHKPFASVLDKINLNTLAMETTPLIQGVMCATKAKEDTDLQFQEKSVEIMERLGKLERDNKLIFLDKDMEYRKFEGEEKQRRRDYKLKIKQMKAQSDLQIKLQQLKLVNGTSVDSSFENDMLMADGKEAMNDKNKSIFNRFKIDAIMNKTKTEALIQKRQDVEILKTLLAETRAQQELCNEQRRLENTKAKKLHFVHPSSATSAHFITSNESCEVADRIRFLELWDYKKHATPIEVEFIDKDTKIKAQEMKELAKKVVVNNIEFNNYIHNLISSRVERTSQTVMNLRIKLCAEMDREEMYLFHTGRKFKHSVYRVINSIYDKFSHNRANTVVPTRYAIIYHEKERFIIDLWEYIYKRNSFPICTIYSPIPSEMSSKYMTKNRETGRISDNLVMNSSTKGKYKASLVTTDDTNLSTPGSPLNFSFEYDDTLASRNGDYEMDKNTVILDNQQPSCSDTTVLDDEFDSGAVRKIPDFPALSAYYRGKIRQIINRNKYNKFNVKSWKINALKMISYTHKSMQAIINKYDSDDLVQFNKSLRSQLSTDQFLSEDVIDGFFRIFLLYGNPHF